MIRLQRGPLEVVDIIPRHWRSRKHKVFTGPAEATQFLRELVFDSGSAYLVRDLLTRALRHMDVNLYSDVQLIDRLAREVLYGELKVVISIREAPMPPQVQKPPDLPVVPALDIPSIPVLPPLQLPALPSLNINLQLDVLDLAAMLGLALAEICPSTPGSDSSGSGSGSSTATSSDSNPSPSTTSASSDTSPSQTPSPSSEHSSDTPQHSSDTSPSQTPSPSSEHSSDTQQSSDTSQQSSETSSGQQSSGQQSSDTSTSQSSDSQPIVHKLTLSDPHFNFDSAMVVPDFEMNLDAKRAGDKLVSQGLVDIAYAMELSAKFPHHRLLVAGHTDTMGAADYNQKLSEARANAVLALLANNRDNWVSAVSSHYDALNASRKKRVVIDLQYIMTWAARYKGWSCDPKGIDGIEGKNTDSAIQEFENQTGATVDLATPSSWLGPTFDLYTDFLTNLPKVKSAGGLQACVAATNDPTPVAVGFGLRFPLEGSADVQVKDEVNRRVELIWFPPAPGDSYSYLSDDTVEVYTGNAVINADLLSQNGWDPEPKLYTTGDATADGSSSGDEQAPCDQLDIDPTGAMRVCDPLAEPAAWCNDEDDKTPEPLTYVVQKGDTLSAISLASYGEADLWYLIWVTNQTVIGLNWNLIYPGQLLLIHPLASFGDDAIADAKAQSANWQNPPSDS